MEIYYTIGYEAAFIFHLTASSFFVVGIVAYLIWRDWAGGMFLSLSLGVMLISGVVMMWTSSETSEYDVHPLQGALKLGVGVALTVLAALLWRRKQWSPKEARVFLWLLLGYVATLVIWFEPGGSVFW
ncbi:hypothetical protein [Saccharomonospora sp. NB11]|uniref:hypothetical protein n=1 Tax=Saccharomonospora sp. NB11 TaxID=1642298 RepID=UPI0018D03D50|nr:hypothetical protein [Saccharomonospora sp. NB11]